MDVEPTFVPFLTGYTYTKRRYTPEINTEADETVEFDLTSKFGLLGVEEPKSSLIVDEFRCGIKGCKSTFTDVQAYEAHYNSAHKNVCQFCKKIYPTPFWLEVHVLEHHDNYFKLLSTRQNMYQCLVESCNEKFLNEEKRKQHLIHVHAYPKTFDFQNLSARSIKRKPKKTSKANENENSAKNSPLPENKTKPTKRPRNPFNKMDIEEDNNDASSKTEATDQTTNSSDPMTTEQLKDDNNIKENNNGTSGTPTASTRGNKQRNVNQRGRGGRNNNKKHGTSDAKNDGTTSASEENSMQVESSSQQQVVFKGSVPKTFHFGRGRGRGMRGKPAQQNNTRPSSDKDTNTNNSNDVQMNS